MDYSYVKKGDRVVNVNSAEFTNAVVALLRKEFSAKRGFTDNIADTSKPFVAPRHPIYIRANDDIVPYSIFTIGKQDTVGSGSGTGIVALGFNPRYPKAYSKQITTEVNPVYVVNDLWGLGTDGDYLLDILSDENPHLVNYDDSATGTGDIPTLGDEVGVIPYSYKVGTGYTGLVCVSAPDLVDKVIWVVRSNAYATWYIGKTTEIIPASDYGTVEQYSHGWAATGNYFTVYNPHDISLPNELKVRWTTYPDWAGWIVEPWHFTEC